MRLVALLLLICSTVSAQLNIKGTEYVIISDMGIENITVPRTNEERFSELDWDQINEGDLTSIVKAFVRDAVSYGANLDLSDLRHQIQIASSRNWNHLDEHPPNQPAATSYGSVRPGFNIRINDYWWNHHTTTGIRKVKLVYHELGHALLHLGHLCDFVWQYHTNEYGYQQGHQILGIMSTQACDPFNRNDVIAEYNLIEIEDLIRHFFEVQVKLPGATSKGVAPEVIHN